MKTDIVYYWKYVQYFSEESDGIRGEVVLSPHLLHGANGCGDRADLLHSLHQFFIAITLLSLEQRGRPFQPPLITYHVNSFFSLLFLPLTICLLLFVLSYVKFEREHQCLQGDTRNPQQFGRCSCQGEKTDEADSKEGESCLFLRVCCMSSGSPFSHFTACNMCSFSVSHSTNIFVSYCLQHHGPAMNYPCVLSVFLLHYPLLNLPLVSALVYERSNGANPTDLQMPMYFLSSLPSSPAHKVWPKSSPPWDSQPPCVLTAPALPKVWPREADPFSKRIRDSSITEAGVQTKAVFLETSRSHSQLICLIVSGFPHAC